MSVLFTKEQSVKIWQLCSTRGRQQSYAIRTITIGERCVQSLLVLNDSEMLMYCNDDAPKRLEVWNTSTWKHKTKVRLEKDHVERSWGYTYASLPLMLSRDGQLMTFRQRTEFSVELVLSNSLND